MNIVPETLTSNYQVFHCSTENGMKMDVLNLGGIIQRLILPNGVDVVLGYDTPEEYVKQSFYLGTAIGPYANRIENACFTLNQTTYTLEKNNGANTLHSGSGGLHSQIFSHTIEKDRLILTHLCTQENCGFPHQLLIEIHYILREDSSLTLEYKAKPTHDTYVNLTNHSYFNLNGTKDTPSCLNHSMTLFADSFTVNDPQCIPTGEISSVETTPLDFRTEKAIGKDIFHPSMADFKGYDHNYIVNSSKTYQQIAKIQGEKAIMEVLTDCPCVQFYTANFITPHQGKSEVTYDAQSGFCLETGVYPNAMHIPSFPSPLVKAGETWHYQTTFQFHVVPS